MAAGGAALHGTATLEAAWQLHRLSQCGLLGRRAAPHGRRTGEHPAAGPQPSRIAQAGAVCGVRVQRRAIRRTGVRGRVLHGCVLPPRLPRAHAEVRELHVLRDGGRGGGCRIPAVPRVPPGARARPLHRRRVREPRTACGLAAARGLHERRKPRAHGGAAGLHRPPPEARLPTRVRGDAGAVPANLPSPSGEEPAHRLGPPGKPGGRGRRVQERAALQRPVQGTLSTHPHRRAQERPTAHAVGRRSGLHAELPSAVPLRRAARVLPCPPAGRRGSGGRARLRARRAHAARQRGGARLGARDRQRAAGGACRHDERVAVAGDVAGHRPGAPHVRRRLRPAGRARGHRLAE